MSEARLCVGKQLPGLILSPLSLAMLCASSLHSSRLDSVLPHLPSATERAANRGARAEKAVIFCPKTQGSKRKVLLKSGGTTRLIPGDEPQNTFWKSKLRANPLPRSQRWQWQDGGASPSTRTECPGPTSHAGKTHLKEITLKSPRVHSGHTT